MTQAPADDEARWDARHMGADETDPEPSRVLVEFEAKLPRGGRALDLACGRGRNATWLAVRGFDVDAVDVSTIGLAKARTLAERRGVSGRLHTIAHDLRRGLPPLAPPYDVVTCLHYRQPDLWPRLAPLLAEGGVLVLETLARDATNLDVTPDHLSERDELLAAATGLVVEFHGRCAAGRRATDRLLARRVR